VHRDRELGGACCRDKGEGGQLEMLLPLGLEQNLPQCGVVGDTGVSLWDGGESGLELRRLGRGQGCKDPYRHQGREVRTQRPLLLVQLFNCPHSSHRLLSLLQTIQEAVTWHGLATQWLNLSVFYVCVIKKSALVLSPGIQASGSRAGGSLEAKGWILSPCCPGEQ